MKYLRFIADWDKYNPLRTHIHNIVETFAEAICALKVSYKNL